MGRTKRHVSVCKMLIVFRECFFSKFPSSFIWVLKALVLRPICAEMGRNLQVCRRLRYIGSPHTEALALLAAPPAKSSPLWETPTGWHPLPRA